VPGVNASTPRPKSESLPTSDASSSDNRETVTGDQALDRIRAGAQDPIRVNDVLDLRGFDGSELPSGLSCFDLLAVGSSLRALPDDLVVTNRLRVDQSPHLEQLPTGLTVGSLSARRCPSLTALPEGLDTWFLDLEGSDRFHQWPEQATVHRGQVSLRNCLSVQSLPPWFDRLASLNLAGCFDLRVIPDGLTVSQWVDVGGTRIQQLPDSLHGCRIHWRGVTVPPRIAFEPDSLTAAEVTQEPNAEIRRVMIERMGYDRFAREAGAKVLHEDTDPGGQRQLLSVELEEDETLVGLRCFCPSTGNGYLLRVPPDTKTCHQAAAWLAGFDDPADYHPLIET